MVQPAVPEADPFSAMSAENRAAWAQFWQDWRADAESEPSECSADEGLSDVSTADTELVMELAEEAPFETLWDRHPELFGPDAEPPTAEARAESDADEQEQALMDIRVWHFTGQAQIIQCMLICKNTLLKLEKLLVQVTKLEQCFIVVECTMPS